MVESESHVKRSDHASGGMHGLEPRDDATNETFPCVVRAGIERRVGLAVHLDHPDGLGGSSHRGARSVAHVHVTTKPVTPMGEGYVADCHELW
jgi:hypothetical protein